MQSEATRVVDRFYSLGGFSGKIVWKCADSNREFVTLRVVGDGFLTGQVRRMVGTLVGVVQGWLPEEFIEFSQRPDVVVDTPLAPSGLVLISEARFDWHSNALNIFQHKKYSAFDQEVYKKIDENISSKLEKSSSLQNTSTESFFFDQEMVESQSYSVVKNIINSDAASIVCINEWLKEMKETVCPRIVNQRDNFFRSKILIDENTNDTKNTNKNCPIIYSKVLYLLNQADRSIFISFIEC
jgi:hypothetical protein